jgi:hypothetical protein
VSCAFWNVPQSGDADDAMFIYSAVEMPASELCIVEHPNMPGSIDADDAMFIYSALKMTGSELCIVECAREC